MSSASEKNYTSLGVSLLALVVLGVLLLLTRQAKIPLLVSRTDPPKVSMVEKAHDLGDIHAGNAIPYTFKIRNLGGEPLVISKVTSPCDCTLLNLKDKIIDPGKDGQLEAILDTSALKEGETDQTITILSNDPKQPAVQIALSANVLPPMPGDKVETSPASDETSSNTTTSQ